MPAASNGFDAEMQRALLEDAAKLRALGVDVADPIFLEDEAEPEYSGGACFYCGCRETLACIVTVDGEPQACRWHRVPDHRGFAVCSNPECVQAYIADTGAP